MFCKNCGHDIVEGLTCPNCGEEQVEEIVTVEEEKPVKNHRIWDVFARVAFGAGIATFIATFVTFGFMIFSSVLALVISCLGKKSIDYKNKANTGFKLSLVSTILSAIFIILVLIAIIVCSILITLGVITTAGIIAIIFATI